MEGQIRINKIQQKQLTISENQWRLISGGIAGGISRTCVAPFERTIILRQTNNVQYKHLNLYQTILQMFKSEGVLGLFKGNGANCLRICPSQAIEFFMFDKLRLSAQKLKYDFFKNQIVFASGAIAGITAATVVYPLDLIRTLLSMPKEQTNFTNVGQLISKTYKSQGFVGFYRGWTAVIIGYAPYASLKLGFFQTIKNNLPNQYRNSINYQRYNKSYNRSFCWLSCFNFLLSNGCYKTQNTNSDNILMQEDVSQRIQLFLQKKQPIQTQLSYKGFYAGLSTTYLKVVPSTAIAFLINERLKIMRSYQ